MAMKRILLSALAMATITQAAPSAAQTASAVDLSDMSCLLAAAEEDPTATKEVSDSMTLLAIYYVGKLYGRNPAFDMDSFVRTNADALDKMSAEGGLVRCSEELGKRGDALTRAGNILQGK
jgi:hypothetical protein